MAQPAVAFYVIEAAGGNARLKVACRIIGKAWAAGNAVIVVHQDAAELRALDELLWTHEEHSFIPHEVVAAQTAAAAPGAAAAGEPGAPRGAAPAPVLLALHTPPPGPFDVLVNLADRLPADLSQVARVAEIIDGEPPRREAGRLRFKAYRDLGITPASHNIRA